MENTEEFLEACKSVALELCRKKNRFPIQIISHFDTDGITAASILSLMLKRRSIAFHLKVVNRLEYDYLDHIETIIPKNSTIVFCDLGSGVIDAFYKWDPSIQIYILDHHFLNLDCHFPENIHVLNPHCYSIDGSTAISGSGIAYFVAKANDPKNTDLAYLSIIGALGDRQDQGENSSLIQLNSLIVQDAIKQNLCTDSVSLWFFDRSRDIITILKRLKIEDLSDNLSIRLFLERIGVPATVDTKTRSMFDLKEEEKKKIASELIVNYNVDPKHLYKHDYLILEEKINDLRDTRVFANRLNACGRMGRPDVGVAICMGDRHLALAELAPIMKEYSELIRKGLNWAIADKNLKSLTSIYFLDGRTAINESLLGPITSILSTMKNYQQKPILSCANIDKNRVKISTRRSQLLKEKVELNKILIKGAAKLGLNTEVGGHSAAAGAIIQESNLNSFINEIDTLMKELILPND
jgi:RecJ-like exonuclease